MRRPAVVKKIAVAEKKPSFLHAGVALAKGGGEAPAVMVTTPTVAAQAAAAKHGLASPRACLCSPTTHAGSFRCRLHRGSFGSGLHEMGKKKPAGA